MPTIVASLYGCKLFSQESTHQGATFALQQCLELLNNQQRNLKGFTSCLDANKFIVHLVYCGEHMVTSFLSAWHQVQPECPQPPCCCRHPANCADSRGCPGPDTSRGSGSWCLRHPAGMILWHCIPVFVYRPLTVNHFQLLFARLRHTLNSIPLDS